jgi:hypothetical protein
VVRLVWKQVGPVGVTQLGSLGPMSSQPAAGLLRSAPGWSGHGADAGAGASAWNEMRPAARLCIRDRNLIPKRPHCDSSDCYNSKICDGFPDQLKPSIFLIATVLILEFQPSIFTAKSSSEIGLFHERRGNAKCHVS